MHVAAETTPYGRRRDAAVAKRWARSRWSPPVRRTPWGRGWSATARGGPYQVFTPSPGPGASTAGPSRPPRPRSPDLGSASTPTSRRPDLLERGRWPPRRSSMPTAGEDAAWRRWRHFRDELLTRLRGRPRPPRPRRHVPALALPPPRGRCTRARSSPRSATPAGDRTLRGRARLARVLRRRALAPPRLGVVGPQARAGRDALRRAGGRDRGLAHRHHRLPDRRRRDAPAARTTGWMHNRVRMITASLPHQGPARLVAGRRAALPRPAHRRRRRVQQPRLAVGGRHRHRRLALLPGLQPGHPGHEVRPRRRLRTPLGARAGPPARQAAAHEPWKSDVGYEQDYPLRIVDHADERLEALERYQAARG